MPDLRELMKEAPVHFMGIGGAGMCALAEAVLREGGRVSGCDLAPGPATHALERMGVRILKGHDPTHLADASALVISAAVPPEHPEVAEARARGIPVLKRAVALGGWVDHGRVIAVAGTHGKTTTTAMITSVLESGGLRPTGFVGGEVAGWESHLRAGAGELFVVEADEYDRSFHHLRPSVAVITNLEGDHLDVYGSLDGVREGFRTFLSGVRAGGTVIACADDPGAGQIVQGLELTVVTYGLSAGSMLRGAEVERSPTGARVRVREGGNDAGSIEIPLPGLHNVRNALGAAATARALGVGWDRIREGLAGFGGVRRRFQRLGEARGIAIVDDYAHHPTEVRAALEAARHAFPRRRLVAVFQPHLFTRTRDLAAEFGEALALADASWVTAVYPAREAPIEGVDAGMVTRAIERAGGRDVHLHADLGSLARALAESLQEGDLCLTLGAGSIERTGPELLELLRGEESDDA